MSFAPVYDDRSRALILGTWPSPKSREMAFYYGHPQNRFCCPSAQYKPRQRRLQPRPAGGDLGRCAGGLDRKMMTRL